MLTLAMAVLGASLLGSLHCVGMCGPFALWATAGAKGRTSLVAYHFGRLTTYLSAALVAGVIGSAITFSGDMLGLQSLAARVAGSLLIVVGVVRLIQLIPLFHPRRSPTIGIQAGVSSRIAFWLHRTTPLITGLSPTARAYFGGVVTTWLPCGWLYLFILVAAGTGGVVPAAVVMLAFWIGTLPALTALVLGARTVMPWMRSIVPVAASILLVVTGLYTATGRASADLSSMLPPKGLPPKGLTTESDLSSLVNLTEQPLPCCEDVESILSPQPSVTHVGH